MTDVSPDPRKEGLQSALDVTKFNVAIAGGAIAFLLDTDSIKYAVTSLQRTLLTLALIGFGVSAICGILVLLEGASMIAGRGFNLDNYIVVPGVLNFAGLMAAFLFASAYVFVVIWWQTDP